MKEGARPDAQPKPSRGDTTEQARAGSGAQEPPKPDPSKPQDPAKPSQQPTFRGSVDLVSLNVTVAEGARYVTDLTADDFTVSGPSVAR